VNKGYLPALNLTHYLFIEVFIEVDKGILFSGWGVGFEGGF